MVTPENVFLDNPDGPVDAVPLVAIRNSLQLLLAGLPAASLAISLADGSSLLCLASTGDIISEGTYLPVAAIPGLTAAQPGLGIYPFQCSLPGVVGRFAFAFATPVFSAGRMLGCILAFTTRPPAPRARVLISNVAESLAPSLLALSPSPSAPATPGFGPRSIHFMADCRSEVSVIYSAVECLERYGDVWDEATWLRYLGRIKASAAKLSALLDS